jgi:hypothetical protein
MNYSRWVAPVLDILRPRNEGCCSSNSGWFQTFCRTIKQTLGFNKQWQLTFTKPFLKSTVSSTTTFILFYFNFRTVHFVLRLGITNKCINSDQFIISLCCSYMFRQLGDILRELVCTFWVTCQFGFLVDNSLCSMWLSIDTHQAAT